MKVAPHYFQVGDPVWIVAENTISTIQGVIRRNGVLLYEIDRAYYLPHQIEEVA